MAEIVKNLYPNGQNTDIVRLVVYNTLPYKRDVIVSLDMYIKTDDKQYPVSFCFKSSCPGVESPMFHYKKRLIQYGLSRFFVCVFFAQND